MAPRMSYLPLLAQTIYDHFQVEGWKRLPSLNGNQRTNVAGVQSRRSRLERASRGLSIKDYRSNGSALSVETLFIT
eukprot:1187230-Prorocentrum_minimum.AAC.2